MTPLCVDYFGASCLQICESGCVCVCVCVRLGFESPHPGLANRTSKSTVREVQGKSQRNFRRSSGNSGKSKEFPETLGEPDSLPADTLKNCLQYMLHQNSCNKTNLFLSRYGIVQKVFSEKASAACLVVLSLPDWCRCSLLCKRTTVAYAWKTRSFFCVFVSTIMHLKNTVKNHSVNNNCLTTESEHLWMKLSYKIQHSEMSIAEKP